MTIPDVPNIFVNGPGNTMLSADINENFDVLKSDINSSLVAINSPIVGALPFENIIFGEVGDANKVMSNLEFIRSQVNLNALADNSPIVGAFPFTLKNNTTRDADQVNANFQHLVDEANANATSSDTNGLWAWGNNTDGRLGFLPKSQTNSNIRTLPFDREEFKDFNNSLTTSRVIKADGTMWAAGDYGSRSKGDNVLGDSEAGTYVQVGSASDWDILNTSNHGGSYFAIKNNGNLWGYGDNSDYSLGNGNNSDTTAYALIDGGDWIDVATTYAGGCGIKSDGTLWSWGLGSATRVVGDGSSNTRSTPVQIGSNTDWVQVSATFGGRWALNSAGGLYFFGGAASGEVGDGTTGNRVYLNPALIISGVAFISSHYLGSALVKSDGTLYETGNLKMDSASDTDSWRQVGAASNWVSSYVGDNTASSNRIAAGALNLNGDLWLAGYNFHRQLARLPTTSGVSFPFDKVADGMENWKFKKVSMAGDAVIALTSVED